MDQTAQILALIGVAALGILAVVTILRRDRVSKEAESHESPFAASTEGMLRCPSCGTGNLVTDGTCSSCGKQAAGLTRRRPPRYVLRAAQRPQWTTLEGLGA